MKSICGYTNRKNSTESNQVQPNGINNNNCKPKPCCAIKDHLTSVSNFCKHCHKTPKDDNLCSMKNTPPKSSQVFTCLCNLSIDRLIELRTLKPVSSKCPLCDYYQKSKQSLFIENVTNGCFSKDFIGEVPINGSHSSKETCKKAFASTSKTRSVLDKFENVPTKPERRDMCDNCPKPPNFCSKLQSSADEPEKNYENNVNINDLVVELVRTTKRVKKIAGELVGEDNDLNEISNALCAIQKDHCQLLSLVEPKTDVCCLFEESKCLSNNRSKSEESVYESFAKACLAENPVKDDQKDSATKPPVVVSKKKISKTKKNKTKDFTVLTAAVTVNPVEIREAHTAKLAFEPSRSFTDDEEIESKILDGWDIESSACALKKQNRDNHHSEPTHSVDNLQTGIKMNEASSSRIINKNTNKKNKSKVISNAKGHKSNGVDKKLTKKCNRMTAAGSNIENGFCENSLNVFLRQNSEIIQSQRNENLQGDTNFKIAQQQNIKTGSFLYDNRTHGIISHNKVV